MPLAPCGAGSSTSGQALAQRSRKPRAGAPRRAHAPAADEARPGRAARSEARDAEVRAQLEPLRPGERPPAVTVAAIAALALAVANLALFATGYRIKGGDTPIATLVVFELLLLIAAAGLWRVRYWAVLAFEALLGLILVFTSLSLILAQNVAAVAICVAVLVPASVLFYKLIRAMARIQAPERPSEP